MMIQANRTNGHKEGDTPSNDAGANMTPTAPSLLLTIALFSAVFSFLFTGVWAVSLLHFHEFHPGMGTPQRQEEQNLYLRFGFESGSFSQEEATIQKLEQTRRALQADLIYACIKTGKGGKGGDVRIVSSLSDCSKSERGVQLNAQGPPGK
jgi:hypothetical protein